MDREALMKKMGLEAVSRNYDPKGENGSEAAFWRALESMFSQRLISTIVPSRINLSRAVVSRRTHLHRHAVCKLQSGEEVTVILASSDGGWHTPGGVIEYADGRRLNLEARMPAEMPMLWIRWTRDDSPLDLWSL